MIKISFIKKACIVAAITVIAAIVSLIVTSVKASSSLNIVGSSYVVSQFPTKANIDVNKFIVNSYDDSDIIDSILAASQTSMISRENYGERIAISITADKNIALIVKDEDPQNAVLISEKIICLLDHKLHNVASEMQKSNQENTQLLIDRTKNKIDSLKQELLKIEKQYKAKGSPEMQQAVLEIDPDYIVCTMLMDEYTRILCNHSEELYQISEDASQPKSYIISTSSAKADEAVLDAPNKLKIICVTAMLAFFISICLIVFVEKIDWSKLNKADQQ